MRKLLISFLVIFIVVNPVNVYPITEQDKDNIFCCYVALEKKKDDGKWGNIRLNNMIILMNYGILPPDNIP